MTDKFGPKTIASRPVPPLPVLDPVYQGELPLDEHRNLLV
jgi:hypothetical protein